MGDMLSIDNNGGKKNRKYILDGVSNFFRYGVCSMQGWRPTMEDCFLAEMNIGPNKNIHVFAIFDGHGGREVANYIKNHFIESFLNNLSLNNDNMEVCLKETFLSLDKQLDSLSAMKEMTQDHFLFLSEFNLPEEREINYMNDDKGIKYTEDLVYSRGCTGLVLVIRNEKEIYFANAGDSRGLLIRKKNAFVKMTIDHKPTNSIESQRIKKAGCKIYDNRINGQLNLSRGFGDFQFKLRKDLKPENQAVTVLPEIKTATKSERDSFIILACDGIWDCVTNEKISKFIVSKVSDEPEKKLSLIIADLFDRIISDSSYDEKGTDNMTCILLQFN